jgi:anti-sigma regulatory factor (Ser/Thr protein kinase)
MAAKVGLNPTDAGKVAIIASEAASNLHKHARQGLIALRSLQDGESQGIEILSIDKGPGIQDVAKALADGYSTRGSPGTGLGAISRVATVFDLYTQPGGGTVLAAQLWSKASRRRPAAPLILGVVCAPYPGEAVCGDAWTVRHFDGRSQIFLVDGLGHGQQAHHASQTALGALAETNGVSPAHAVRELHGPLRATRGASLALAEVSFSDKLLRYAGAGNIGGAIVSGEASRSLISHNGTVGHELHRVQEFTYPWPEGATLIMHSDGLLSRWKLDAYPGLLGRHPAVIAGVLFRDFQRPRDDVSVLVARAKPSL